MFGQNNDMSQAASTPVSTGMPSYPADNSSIDVAAVNELVQAPIMGAPTVNSNTFSGSAMQNTPAATSDQYPSMITTSRPADPDMGSDLPSDDLALMKQEALKHLQPLVGSLQQSPEEEFRTVMMMIQATDDKTMLKKALDSAKRITDDKVRAQAMLDVINEINYFTQAQ